MADKYRCVWADGDALNKLYHDTQWGKPEHSDRMLFEMLILEGAQAGLSWITILKKREGYKKAFADFDPQKVAAYDIQKVTELLANPEIIRNRLKIAAAIKNAQAFLKVQKEFGSFDAYIWKFVGGKQITNKVKNRHDIPAKTEQAEVMSRDLLKRGFTFVGPTICYAFMQATGMVNDHETRCFRYNEVSL